MRYIDADKLKEKVSNLICKCQSTNIKEQIYTGAVNDTITQLFPKVIDEFETADVVEVVRCKDCKHSIYPFQLCRLLKINDSPEHYCSYGQKKEEN